MNWTPIKTALETLAPWIAGSLGTPAAGEAVAALEQVFGLTPGTATPDNLSVALAGATPDQIAALKAAELHHQEVMASFGYKLNEGQIQINLADAKSKNWWQSGWRPYLAWWLVNAFVYHVVLFPILVGFFPQLHDMDSPGFAAVSSLLLTLIGARSYEKTKDIDTK